jgi:N-acetylneuraminic acid mutarotase
MTAVTIDGKIYVAGGWGPDGRMTQTLYVYTPATDTWTRGADMPVAGASDVADVIGGKLYVLVGCLDCTSQRLYRYDPATDTWSRLADPPRHHGGGAGANIDGKLYVAWGSTSSVDMYDPVTDSWSLKLTMTRYGEVGDFGGLWGSAAVNFNKKLYVIGGRSDDNSRYSTLAYDPVLNAWEDKAPMARARTYPAAGKVKDAAGVLQILVVGGTDSWTGDDVTDTEAYTP